MKGLSVFLLILSFTGQLAAQVNMQSGSATFTLPMFSWQDDRSRLNSSIDLNYNSGSGLKVSEVASCVGQGWNLAAGGVVTRIQAGEPDDQVPIDGSIEDTRKCPPGYLYNPSTDELGCPAALATYPLFGDKNHIYKQHNSVAADREVDRFLFQFNGRSGIFVLDKSSMADPMGTGRLLGDSRVKISFIHNDALYSTMQIDNGVRTSITEFDIQDENGLIYKFSTVEKTKVLRTGYSNAQLQEERKQPNFKHGNVYHEAAFDKHDLYNPYVINSWYLTEIEDALTHRRIIFNYGETMNINSQAGTSLSYYAGKDYTMISHKTSVTSTPALTSILYPDGHTVTMHYGAYRVDLTGDRALASIDITYAGRYLSKYQLTTSYFIRNYYGTPVTPSQKDAARLCLLSVQKVGVDLKASEPPYSFDYHMGSSNPDDFVPPPFYHIKDIWGYYNGNYSHDYDNDQPIPLNIPIAGLSNNRLKGLCFLRQPFGDPQFFNAKPGYAKNGLLKRISYPTGGTLDYEYEQNQAVIAGQSRDAAGVHVSVTKLTDGGYSNDCSHPIVTNYTYRLGLTDNTTSLWGLEEKPLNWRKMSSSYSPQDKYFRYKFPFNLGCDYHYLYPGIQSRDQSISLNTAQQVLVAASKIMEVVSAIMFAVDLINLALDATPAVIVAVIIDVVAIAAGITLSCLPNPDKNEEQTIFYNIDFNSINPLPVQFKRVEVTESSGGNGRTVMEFTSRADYEVWEPDNPELSMKQRYAHWAYGLPKKTTVLDASNNIVRQTENIYNWDLAKTSFFHPGTAAFGSCKCVIDKTSSIKSTQWANPSYYDDHSTYVYDHDNPDADIKAYHDGCWTGRVELKDVYERVYKQGTPQYLQTVTHYGYNDYNYQVNNISVVQSNGDEIVKHIIYSGDYFNGEVPSILNANNIVSIPVSTTEGIIKHSTNSNVLQYLSEKVTEFTVLPTGDIKPLRTLEQRLSQPGPLSAGNYKEVQHFIYEVTGNSDAIGNLIGMTDEGGHTVSNVYDYSNKYVVASVINADPELDKPAYTSFETAVLGGWTLSGSGLPVSGTAVTGTRYLPLAGSSLSASLANGQKPYTLSFWATNTSVNVNGNATLVKSGPTIGGYTYFEYTIAQGTATVNITGNANIDELRLYPQTARMRTVSYDPLIGKTSECDENNRISYFEYDELGRLRFLKDEARNIIKMYEYNYASKRPSNCLVIYQNRTIRELFMPDNCPSGYTTDPVEYVIPEGTYSSIISQADADKKAQDDLLANGLNHANTHHGTCIQIFSNDPLSQTFTKQGCAPGTVGTTITYSVPAGKYTSTISQADANQEAQDEMDANGQAFANMPGNASCVVSTDPDWQATGTPQFQCQTDANGNLTGHQLVLVTDVNPNSNSNPRTQWKDIGVNPSACPAPVAIYAKISYENSYSTSYSTSADVVVRFYSDAACTQPVTVSNLTVEYKQYTTCDNGCPGTNQTYTTVVNGSSSVLVGGALITYTDVIIDEQGNYYSCTCWSDYSLFPRSGYTIVP